MLHSLFFFNDTATTEIYTLSLHDALPIYSRLGYPYWSPSWRYHRPTLGWRFADPFYDPFWGRSASYDIREIDRYEARSEEHTSELQSRQYLVCRLLLEKKKMKHHTYQHLR